jgi:hypothetical protein
MDGEISLVSLQQLPLLRDLELESSFPDPYQFGHELRALPWLHRLRIHAFGKVRVPEWQRTALFNALLRDAPEEELYALRWRDFAMDGFHFTDERTPLLLRLSSLERLEASVPDCSRFGFLCALSRLACLELHMMGMRGDAWMNLLHIFTSAGLARLHTLYLHAGPCTVDDLVQILSHTPSLTSLMLRRLSEVDSLSFFHQPPKLAETLTGLTVECGYSCTWAAADLRSLLVLQELRVLRLLSWPKKERLRLTAEDRAPFEQRPCTVLPHLEVFEWTMEEL